MLRFLALLADPRSAAQYEALHELGGRLGSQHWHLLHESNALHVWSTQPCPTGRQALLKRQCMLIGSVFPCPSMSTVADEGAHALAPQAFDAAATKRILATRGASLLAECWGDYVAILHDLATMTTRIIKDPTGSLPCQLTYWRELIIAFSCVEDVASLGAPRFTIRPTFLRHRARFGPLYMLDAPLNEVTPVMRGEWVDIAHRGGPRLHGRGFGWHPRTFASRGAAIEAPAEAARTLEATLRTCTATLLQHHTRPLLRLSGGLDSSIIAACMAASAAPHRAYAYTHYDPTAIRDERPWASIVAGHLNLLHRCEPMDPTHVDMHRLEALHPQIYPAPLLSYLQRAPLERRLAEELGSQAIVTGLGGDSLLGADALGYAPSEWLHYHLPSPRLVALAAQAARVTQQSMWTLITRALRRRVFGPSRSDNRRAMGSPITLIHPAMDAQPVDEEHYPHPWFADATRIRWPIVRRLGELLVAPHYDWADAPAAAFSPTIVSPLYAQPVVELCLRIPLHVHFLNGVERGLARSAFARHLPRKILARTWKDRAPGYLEQLFDRNLPYLRERLLDGVLARSHVINRRAIDKALQPALSRDPTLPGELLHLLEIELWAQHWQ